MTFATEVVNDLFGRLRARAASHPDKPAVIFQHRNRFETVTYAELVRGSLSAAQHLQHKSVAPGEVVAIMLPHSIDCFYYFFGAMAFGAVPAFFPPPTPKQSAEYFWSNHAKLFDVSRIFRIVSSRLNFELLSNYSSERKTLVDPAEIDIHEPLECQVRPASDSLAFLQHSSGTTGLKKGVMLTHGAVTDQLDAYGRAIDFGEIDVVASWLPLYHDMGLITSFLLPLTAGATLISIDPFAWIAYPPLLLEAIERHRATFCWLPNFSFNLLANTRRREYDLTSVRAFINCSEPCFPATHEKFAAAFRSSGIDPTRVQVCYAMAETVFAVTQTLMGVPPRLARQENEGKTREFVSCGKPLDGVRMRIVDPAGNDSPAGNVGQVFLACRYMFDGYYNRPEITKEKWIDGWYVTGDLGFLLEGELYIISRVDDVIVAHGKNWHAIDIEASLDGLKGVKPGRRVALAQFNAAYGTNDIVVLLETDGSEDELDESLVLEYLRAHTGAPIAGVQTVPAGWIVKTTSGKLNREANMRKFMANERSARER